MRCCECRRATTASSSRCRGRAVPYGRVGVIEPGALADLILVDGDPASDITLIEDPARRFVVIMKDGRIHKHLGR